MEALFMRALQEIEENIDKLPLTSDILRAYQIARDPNYDEYLRKRCIIALYEIIENKRREGASEGGGEG